MHQVGKKDYHYIRMHGQQKVKILFLFNTSDDCKEMFHLILITEAPVPNLHSFTFGVFVLLNDAAITADYKVLKDKTTIHKPYCCTVHPVESLQLLTNSCTYINST